MEDADPRSLAGSTGDEGVEVFADAIHQQCGSGRFAHDALDFVGVVLAIGAVLGQGFQRFEIVWRRLLLERCFEDAVRDQVRSEWRMRTHVPLLEAPVTRASKCSPMRFISSVAAAALRMMRSTLLASSSRLVQCSARASSVSRSYGAGFFSSAALRMRCVIR